MIKYSDEFLLSSIREQNIHFDRKSIEPTTRIENPKYKIVGRILINLGLYIFLPMTKNRAACSGEFRVEIRQADLEDKDPHHLKLDRSYVNPEKAEAFEKQEILLKQKDKQNKFLKVARLADSKYGEIKHKSENFIKKRGGALKPAKILQAAFFEASLADKVLAELLKNAPASKK